MTKICESAEQDTLKTVEVAVCVLDELGLHARPAARIAQAAQAFQADILLCLGATQADAKSILDILSLAAGCGASLMVSCSGVDAEEAAHTLRELFENPSPAKVP